MLSYRHAFHAGNHADVLKHAVLSILFQQLKQKEKPFCYLDTHSGGGCYDLRDEWAQKKSEFVDGIARLWDEQEQWPELNAYFDCIKAVNTDNELHFYPGSPEIARAMLREQDRMILMELHNSEIEVLRQHMTRDARTAIHHRDGFEGLVGVTPPTPRRGLVLIDPPYELKEDYFQVVKTVEKTIKRWSVGIIAIWYPILGRDADRSVGMLKALEKTGLPFITAELCVQEQSATWGMHGSGMAIINPPWQFDEKIAELLPRLTQRLAQNEHASSAVKLFNPQN